MTNISEAFKSLNSNESADDFLVVDIPLSTANKIGRSKEGFPIFFIENSKSSKSAIDRSLAMIGIQYNRKCILYGQGMQFEGYYTVVTLKSNNLEMQTYFIEIFWLAVRKLTSLPSIDDIQLQLESIISLFSKFSALPRKTIQGVWSEMVVIESGVDIDYLVSSWHSSVYSLFDFNDGTDKIEVKSTLRDKRQHKFSLSQLLPNPTSYLAIASLMTAETGIGSTVFDMREMIYDKLTDKGLIWRVDEILALTLGRDIERASELFFDLSMAKDTLQYFHSETIPIIRSAIPIEITNITFDCDLTNLSPILHGVNSRLLESVIK